MSRAVSEERILVALKILLDGLQIEHAANILLDYIHARPLLEHAVKERGDIRIVDSGKPHVRQDAGIALRCWAHDSCKAAAIRQDSDCAPKPSRHDATPQANLGNRSEQYKAPARCDSSAPEARSRAQRGEVREERLECASSGRAVCQGVEGATAAKAYQSKETQRPTVAGLAALRGGHCEGALQSWGRGNCASASTAAPEKTQKPVGFVALRGSDSETALKSWGRDGCDGFGQEFLPKAAPGHKAQNRAGSCPAAGEKGNPGNNDVIGRMTMFRAECALRQLGQAAASPTRVRKKLGLTAAHQW